MHRRYLTGLVVVSWLLLPASASATWGNKCSLGNVHHCYAVAEWPMTGSGNGGGEEVKGISSEFYTTAMLVPEWQQGDFVTNEQWMIGYNGRWVEDGQIAGYNSPTEEGREVNYDSLHWFYAYENTGNGSVPVYVAPWTYNGYEWRSYTLWDPGNNGTWCERIGEPQVACQSGFRKYATVAELGMEAADEQQPENGGKSRTGGQWLDGSWHHWLKANNETVDFNGDSEAGYVCVTPFEAIPGYINFGTPTSHC